MDYILAPSILSADFKVLGEQMKLTEDNGAKYLHFDVMDGMFVPSISFGMPVLKSIHNATDQVMDAHLMVQEPIRYVEAFKEAMMYELYVGGTLGIGGSLTLEHGTIRIIKIDVVSLPTGGKRI